MDPNLLIGEWNQHDRFGRLVDRYQLYFQRTPDSMGNGEAIKHAKELQTWCDLCGFTQRERLQAKKIAMRDIH